MTRFLAPLCLALSLTACPTLEIENYIPSLPETDNSECFVGIFSLIMTISGEGDGYDLLFEDGRTFSVHAPTGQVEVTWDEGDPVVFFMTDLDGTPLSFEGVSDIVNVFPVTETDGGGFQTGSFLEPVEDDPPWVAWNCP